MDYAEHISRLSHSGGLPRNARQEETPDAMRQEIETLRKARNERRAELETLRLEYAAERNRQAAERAAERSAHDAALAAKSAAHEERVRQFEQIIGTALEQHSRRAPALARAMSAAEEALKR